VCHVKKNLMRNLIKPLILSILFLGMTILEPIWSRKLGGFWNILVYLTLVVLFFWLLVKIIKEIIIIIKQRRALNFKLFLPLTIMTLSFYLTFFEPFRINLEKDSSKVVFKACYEGTQNQSTFQLMDNGKFEIHSTGVFFSDNYFNGTYSRNGDTIFLKFDAEKPRLISDTIVIQNEYLFALKKDTLIPTHFYLGFCKGLN